MLIKPRALILDLFGDYLRYVEEVRAGDLGALLGVFGVEPATARVTLSRLRQEGWFETRRSGRETFYRLSPNLLEVLTEGRARIFAPYPEAWDGSWTTVVFQLSESDRALREQIRKRLSWLGFAPLAGSTWVSPQPVDGIADRLRLEFPQAVIDVFESRMPDLDAARELLARLWDLDELNAQYRAFIDDHEDLLCAASELEGAPAFSTRTELTFTYRRFPFKDPWIPAALRPAGWLGAQAHTLFLRIHDELGAAATAYVATTIGAEVPAPASALTTKNM